MAAILVICSSVALTPGLAPRPAARVVRHTRLPVWPAWQGLALGVASLVPALRKPGVPTSSSRGPDPALLPQHVGPAQCQGFVSRLCSGSTRGRFRRPRLPHPVRSGRCRSLHPPGAPPPRLPTSRLPPAALLSGHNAGGFPSSSTSRYVFRALLASKHCLAPPRPTTFDDNFVTPFVDRLHVWQVSRR